MKEDFKGPCGEEDPDNFIINEGVSIFLENKDFYKFKQKDYFRVYNCTNIIKFVT